ncbi:MAG: 7-cyano-7-deazaguanine synthase QueC [Thermoplasmata archaeon]|nr:MAG: 7-cyano-7-deazaguanine synthase QueC [Thermoplasmata archaeon]
MKAVTILSGGADSGTLLYYLLDKGYGVYILTFDYNQKHKKEIEYAKKFVEETKKRYPDNILEHRIVDISPISDLISKGALMKEDEVPHNFYTEETQKQTIVPNRNMILLSIAVGYAIKVGAKKVFYGAHKSDYAIYPDCRKEFVKALDTAVYLGNLWTPVEIEAPFVEMTKYEIIKLGLDLNVPYEYTWSCYEGKERPCLECGTCLERTEAFLLNNSKDKLLTEEEWKKAVEIYYRKKKEI